MNKSSIYTVGGTVQAGSGIYIERNADVELMKACRQGKFAYILTARQMGKSSLMVNTARRLVGAGRQSVIVDLTELGAQANVLEWYLGLMVRIASRLGLKVDLLQWWQERADVGVTQRLSLFFQELVLPEVEGRLVIFIDEIDSTLSLDFTDDFFAAVRYLYNARSTVPDLRRLSFVLIGVARPSDLIDDPRRTPFNIGQRIDLTDFTAEEAAPLAQGLPVEGGIGPEEARQAVTLDKVLSWTGGHPYLTQRLCHELADRNGSGLPVETVVAEIFLGENSDKDNNLQFVHDMLTRRAPQGHRREVLATYQAIRLGRRSVRDEEQSLPNSHLKLSGVVKREGRALVVRNRIYHSVFDRRWIREQWPVTWWDLLPVEVKVAAVVSLLLFIGLVTASLFAFNEQRQAQALANELAAEVILRSEAEAEALSSARLAATREAEAVHSAGLAVAGEEAARAAEATARAEALLRATAESQAISARDQAEEQARLSQARELAVQAENQLETDPERSLLLARESLKMAYTADGEAVLRQALQQSRIVMRLAPDIPGNRKDIVAVYSPDGEFIATATLDDQPQTQVWSAGTGELLFTLAGDRPIFSEDGRTLATTGVTSDTITVSTRNLADGRTTGTTMLFVEQPGFSGIARLSPDLSLVAAVFSDTVAIADSHGGAWRHNLETTVRSDRFVFSADGRQIATNGAGGHILIWDTESGVLLRTLRVQDDMLLPLAFSPDGSRLAADTLTSSELHLWHVPTGDLLYSVATPLLITAVAFSPDGSRLATGHLQSEVVFVRDAATGTTLLELSGHTGSISSVEFAPDGRHLLSGAGDGTARVWDVTPGGRGELLNVSGNPFHGMGYAHEARLVAAASEDGTVWVWDSETGELLRNLSGHEGAVWDADIHPDGTFITSAGADSTVRLWDAETGALLLTEEANDPRAKPVGNYFPGLLQAQFSPDGTRLATGGADGVVRVWDVHASLTEGQGRLLWSGESDIDGIWRIVFTEDGEWLVASVDASVTTMDMQILRSATVEVWDARTGERLLTLVNTDNYRMHGLAVSPDRAFIATTRPTEAAFDIWRVETGEILYTQFETTARINSIAFNADGSLLATGGYDGKVRVWDLETKTIVATLGAFEWLVRDVVFTPDGRHVVASSRDGTVAIFTLDGQELLAIAEKRMTRELTEVECREFLHTGACPVVTSD